MDRFMKEALKEAFSGMRKNYGGPFGAVIVKKGKIISRAYNTVLKDNDPTAHAEINAIRKATKKFKNFHLDGCILYTTCEPCPMCLAAIMWAHIREMYYGGTKDDADRIGFIDAKVYDAMKTAPKIKGMKIKQVNEKELHAPFDEWMRKKDKKPY